MVNYQLTSTFLVWWYDNDTDDIANDEKNDVDDDSEQRRGS